MLKFSPVRRIGGGANPPPEADKTNVAGEGVDFDEDADQAQASALLERTLDTVDDCCVHATCGKCGHKGYVAIADLLDEPTNHRLVIEVVESLVCSVCDTPSPPTIWIEDAEQSVALRLPAWLGLKSKPAPKRINAGR